MLRIGKEFNSWDEVNRFFDEYALSKGFAIRKCRGDHITLSYIDNLIILKCQGSSIQN